MMHKLFLTAVVGMAMALALQSFAAASNASAKKTRVINITSKSPVRKTSTAKAETVGTVQAAPQASCPNSTPRTKMSQDQLTSLLNTLEIIPRGDDDGNGGDLKTACCGWCYSIGSNGGISRVCCVPPPCDG